MEPTASPSSAATGRPVSTQKPPSPSGAPTDQQHHNPGRAAARGGVLVPAMPAEWTPASGMRDGVQGYDRAEPRCRFVVSNQSADTASRSTDDDESLAMFEGTYQVLKQQVPEATSKTIGRVNVPWHGEPEAEPLWFHAGIADYTGGDGRPWRTVVLSRYQTASDRALQMALDCPLAVHEADGGNSGSIGTMIAMTRLTR
ncbi:MAG: hypothetical protein CSA58_12605 [Micrococcales bacterium]|nr:MAG: hypothetical protein CSA58_12605 [Micrococcales bacterium]